MKKYIPFFLLPALCLPATSCQDDENTGNELSIVKSEAYFQAAASKGYIIVSSVGGFTASSSESWCQVSCNGDSVLIAVSDNAAFEGRTALVTISGNEGGEQRVPVSQAGGYFRSDSENMFRMDNTAQTLQYSLSSAFSYETLCDADWLQTEEAADGVLISLSENTSGTPRYTTVKFRCNALDKEFEAKIYQYDTEDLLGEWTAEWTSKNGQKQEATVNVTKDASGSDALYIDGLQEGIRIPATAYNHSIAISTNAYAGQYNSRYDVYINGATASHIIHAKEQETAIRHYYCEPTVEGEEFSYPFVADSTFTDGEAMSGFALSAYLNNKNQGSINEFYDLKLKR